MNKRKSAIYVAIAIVLLMVFNYPFMQQASNQVQNASGLNTYIYIALAWVFTVILLAIVSISFKSNKENEAATEHE